MEDPDGLEPVPWPPPSPPPPPDDFDPLANMDADALRGGLLSSPPPPEDFDQLATVDDLTRVGGHAHCQAQRTAGSSDRAYSRAALPHLSIPDPEYASEDKDEDDAPSREPTPSRLSRGGREPAGQRGGEGGEQFSDELLDDEGRRGKEAAIREFRARGPPRRKRVLKVKTANTDPALTAEQPRDIERNKQVCS
jgi:hypothetical protein